MNNKHFAVSYTAYGKEINQDSWYADDTVGLYIVADGIGSCNRSEAASQLIARTIPEKLAEISQDDGGDVKSILQGAIRKTAQALHQLGKSDSALKSIASSLTLLWLRGGRFWMAQVGDSRAYLFRDSTLRQITEDHSVAFEQYKAGAISKEEIQTHPNQRLLTRCLSATKDFVLSDIYDGEINGGDVFMLCTDGLNKEMKDAEVEALLRDSEDIAETAKVLDRIVEQGNYADDTTVLLIQVF